MEKTIEEIRDKIRDSDFGSEISVVKSDVFIFNIESYKHNSSNVNLGSESFEQLVEISNFLYELVLMSGIRYYKIIFRNDLKFNKISIPEHNFKNCIFNKELIFKKCRFNKDFSFNNCKFKDTVAFDDCKFSSNIRFHYSVFEDTIFFDNTSFEKLVDFYSSKFMGNQQFHLTDFMDRAIFSNTIFEKQAQFLHNRVNTSTVISFENAQFKNSLDISRANFNCQLNFWETYINDKPEESWLYHTDSLFENENNESISYKRIRETFRIVKNELIKSNDIINSLEVKKSELKMYHEELKMAKDFKISDNLILCLSKHSNYYGLRWEKGVFFIFITSLISYILFLLSISKNLVFDFTLESFGYSVRHYFEFLNITNWNFKPFGIDSYNWQYSILFFGKLIIGYGYYQTIQAFRKFGKS